MAQHDYVIDNSTGANVRADINNVLQAIASNNSGSSDPSTTYAFQLFADTSTGTMKIRNAANNAFIELFQLDGTFTLEDGSASTPALAFRDDLNTGIFSGGADEFNIATGGTERFVITSGGNVGIGTTSPDTLLHLAGGSPNIKLHNTGSSASANDVLGAILFQHADADDPGITAKIQCVAEDNVGNSFLAFYNGDGGNADERVRIDSSGNVGIGTSSPSSKLHVRPLDETNFLVRNEGSNIVLASETNSGRDNNRGLDFEATHFTFIEGGSERMRIDSSGNVGIGTTTVGANLEIAKGSEGTYLKVGGDNASNGRALTFTSSTSSSNGALHTIDATSSGGVIALATAGSERMRIDSSGNLFLGGTSNTMGGFFELTKNIGFNDCGIAIKRLNTSTTNRSFMRFVDFNGNAQGSIGMGASTVSYNTSSDYRLKENVVAISDGITRLKTLKPSRFNFIADAETTVDGFLAHEVTAVPEAISGTKDEVDSNNNPVYQGIDQSKLVPLLTAALQEAIAKIEVLETKVAALEAA